MLTINLFVMSFLNSTNPPDIDSVCGSLPFCFCLLDYYTKRIAQAHSDSGYGVGTMSLEECTDLCFDEFPDCVAVDYNLKGGCYLHTTHSSFNLFNSGDTDRFTLYPRYIGK